MEVKVYEGKTKEEIIENINNELNPQYFEVYHAHLLKYHYNTFHQESLSYMTTPSSKIIQHNYTNVKINL